MMIRCELFGNRKYLLMCDLAKVITKKNDISSLACTFDVPISKTVIGGLSAVPFISSWVTHRSIHACLNMVVLKIRTSVGGHNDNKASDIRKYAIMSGLWSSKGFTLPKYTLSFDVLTMLFYELWSAECKYILDVLNNSLPCLPLLHFYCRAVFAPSCMDHGILSRR